MPSPARVLHIDDVEPFTDGVIPWRPLRRERGITAFGINAYSADAGAPVIEEHDELGGAAGRHEELYLVTAGRASFTVDGEAIDAPAGTLVFVGDPSSRREAAAEEDGTTVVVIAGRAGEAYAPSPWEVSTQAALYARRGDEPRARSAVAEALEVHAGNPHALYNVACAEALLGDGDEAVGHLLRAIELESKAREWAAGDRDFDAVREHPRFPAALDH